MSGKASRRHLPQTLIPWSIRSQKCVRKRKRKRKRIFAQGNPKPKPPSNAKNKTNNATRRRFGIPPSLALHVASGSKRMVDGELATSLPITYSIPVDANTLSHNSSHITCQFPILAPLFCTLSASPFPQVANICVYMGYAFLPFLWNFVALSLIAIPAAFPMLVRFCISAGTLFSLILSELPGSVLRFCFLYLSAWIAWIVASTVSTYVSLFARWLSVVITT